MSQTVRPFTALWDTTAAGWSPEEFQKNIARAGDFGYTAIAVPLRWKQAQPTGPDGYDFAPVDRTIARIKARKLAAGLVIDYSVPPAWVDANLYCARDATGKIIADPRTSEPMIAVNAKQVRDWVVALFRACVTRYGAAVAEYQGAGNPYLESTWRHPASRSLDHSKWALEGFRSFIHTKYIDIRALNEAWEAQYKDWTEIPVGEGGKKTTQSEFHAFRYYTYCSWVDHLRKAVKEVRPEAKFVFRLGGTKISGDLYQLSFDLGRYSRRSDVIIGCQLREPWQVNMVRTAAELDGRPWGIQVELGKTELARDKKELNEELAKLGKRVYDLGGFLEMKNWVYCPGSAALAGPENWDNVAAWPFLGEYKKYIPLPVNPPKNNRRAIYISAAEAQFWDGTDLEAARDRWNVETDTGKKPEVDLVSDGMFVDRPEVLKRYHAGIEIPFAKVIARDARNALSQAARMGVRFIYHNPKQTGISDEHGTTQPPLAG
jgi:hypothetical protein